MAVPASTLMESLVCHLVETLFLVTRSLNQQSSGNGKQTFASEQLERIVRGVTPFPFLDFLAHASWLWEKQDYVFITDSVKILHSE